MNTYLKMFMKNMLFYLSRCIDYPLIAPDTLQLNFLYRCNLQCRMCAMKGRDSTFEISLDILKKIIDQAAAMGVPEALVLGGEPFLSGNIFPLIEYIHGRGMRSVIVTNGTLLTRQNLEKIRETGLNHIVVSLDASCASVLSRIRGEGVFEKIRENIERFQDFKQKYKDVHTGISNCVTIMNQNIENLYETVLLSRKMGFYDVVFQPVVPDNTDQVKKGNIADTNIPPEKMEIMRKSIDQVIAFKKSNIENYDFIINSVKNLELIKKYFDGSLTRPERKCYVGFNRIQVTQDFKVYFCVPLGAQGEVSFGNVQHDSLAGIWYSSRARRYRKAIRKSDCCCMQRCAYREDFETIEGLYEKWRYFGKISSGPKRVRRFSEETEGA